MNYFDTEELIRELCSINENDEDTDLDDALFDKFEIYRDQFDRLISGLLPLCVAAESPLSGRVYQGFGKDGIFLVKREVKEQE